MKIFSTFLKMIWHQLIWIMIINIGDKLEIYTSDDSASSLWWMGMLLIWLIMITEIFSEK